MSLESLVIELALVETTQLDCSWLSLQIYHCLYCICNILLLKSLNIHMKRSFSHRMRNVSLDFQRKYASKAFFSLNVL